MGSAPIPIIPVATTCVNVSDYGRGLLRKHGITFLGGLDLGMTALGHALRWLENRGRVRRLPGAALCPSRAGRSRPPEPPAWPKLRGPKMRRGGCWPRRACRWCRAGWPARPTRRSRSPSESGCRWR